jgi:hypothetical protein
VPLDLVGEAASWSETLLDVEARAGAEKVLEMTESTLSCESGKSSPSGAAIPIGRAVSVSVMHVVSGRSSRSC